MEKHVRKFRKLRTSTSRNRAANGHVIDKEKGEKKKIRGREKKRGGGVNIWAWRRSVGSRKDKGKEKLKKVKVKRTVEERWSDEQRKRGSRLTGLPPCLSLFSPCISQYQPIISRITTIFSMRNSRNSSMRTGGSFNSTLIGETQSSAEERQSAIQGAISHCKNSWRQNSEEDSF